MGSLSLKYGSQGALSLSLWFLLLQLSVLVHELLAVEVWREKVFPLMIRHCSRPTTSFPTYLVVSQHIPHLHTSH